MKVPAWQVVFWVVFVLYVGFVLVRTIQCDGPLPSCVASALLGSAF